VETSEFSALAARVAAGLDDVRACLFVSRDGLTLGAFPPGGEAQARQSWDRLVALGGEPERGFLIVGEELWVVARRGWYTGLAVASMAQSPGLLLDRLDSALRAIEETRQREDAAAPPAGPQRPEIPRRPRTPLHREAAGRARGEKAPPVQSEPDGPQPAERLLGEVRRVVDVTEAAPTSAPPEASAMPAPPGVEDLEEITELESQSEVEVEPEPEAEIEPEISAEELAAEKAAAEKAAAEKAAAEKAAAEKAAEEKAAAEKAAAEKAAAEKAAAEKAAAEKAAAEKLAEEKAAAEKAAAEKLAAAEKAAAEKLAAAEKAAAEKLAAAEKAAAEKLAAEKAAAEKLAAERAAAEKAARQAEEEARLAAEEAERRAAEEAERRAAEEARNLAAREARNLAAQEAQRLAAAEAAALAEMVFDQDEAGDNHEADEAGVKDLERSADVKSGPATDAEPGEADSSVDEEGRQESRRGSAEEVDPVALAREFARLLQESEQGEDY
jgi:hypothetical protein